MNRNHLQMVDAVNAAKTQHEHDRAQYNLDGWREAARYYGRHPNMMEADMHSIARFGEDRPMCCGVLLDWQPEAHTGETTTP
jgi:hypothetical protein